MGAALKEIHIQQGLGVREIRTLETADGKWPTFLCEYWHDGAHWSIQFPAPSFEDAATRVKQIGLTGKVLGKVECVISAGQHPERLRLFVMAYCWLRNLLNKALGRS